jgi:hypothetical protein
MDKVKPSPLMGPLMGEGGVGVIPGSNIVALRM